MDIYTALANAFATGLELWNDSRKGAYQRKLQENMRLKYEEENKPADLRSDAVLDNLRFELRVLAIGFSADARTPDPKTKPAPAAS